MKVSEMTNEQLDYLCAKAQGWFYIEKDFIKDEESKPCAYWSNKADNPNVSNLVMNVSKYHPSTNWQQAGELVEKFKIDLTSIREPVDSTMLLDAEIYQNDKWILGTADTPTRAICMAVITSVYGEEVDG